MERRYACPTCKAVFRTGFARCPLDGDALVSISDDPLAGSTFADRYVIEDCIGEGGMGRVYRARHQRVSRRFAIKVLFGDHAADVKMRERFAREAEAASRLSHANVVSVVDFGETAEGLPYLVMDFVEGKELGALIVEAGPMEAARARRLLRALCAGLAHAHEQGLVHRDFKGENVIVTGEGDDEVPRIVDFGIAVLGEVAEADRLTTEGIVVGTPAFMSPEQAMGNELDHRTDLYSLGVLLYEMLAGVLPFEGTPISVARQNLSVMPPVISERVPGLEVDAGLEAIARRLLEKRPEDRYQSAEEVIAAVDAAAAPAAAPVEPAAPAGDHGFTEEVAAMHGSRRWLWIAPALLLLLGGGALWLATRDAGHATAVITEPADAAPVAVTPAPAPDAGVAVAVLDDPQPAPPDAGAAKPIRPRVVGSGKPKNVDRGGEPVDPPDVVLPDPPKAVPPTITTKTLTELYVSVGEAVETAARANPTAAAELRRAYRNIAFQDALRNADMRAEVYQRLQALRRRIGKAN